MRIAKPMSLIRLQSVVKNYHAECILDGVDFRVEEGEKIGLIGRNGTGKSTIFRVITGEAVPDSGTVEQMKRSRVACLDQIPQLDETLTIRQTVAAAFADLIAMEEELNALGEQLGTGGDALMERYAVLQEEFSHRGGYSFHHRIDRVLTGLGFHEEEFDIPLSALSGGQRTRVRLALVLLEDADLLLLDEPENHLDLEAREWLEGFLRNWEKAFVIISHDRHMLTEVVGRIVELERGTVRSYTGNYEAYLAEKALIREQQHKAFERQQAHIAKEERLIDRFRYKASKARFAQSRIKKLDKLERVDAPLAESDTVKIAMREVTRSGQVVLSAMELSMGYPSLQLYKNLSFQVERGERVGIIGPNGAGKSTLLRQLAGDLEGGTGEVRLGHKVKVGVYDQHHASLNEKNDILTEVHAARSDWKPEQIRAFLGRFLFTGEDVFKSISSLSGGERARVALAILILQECNLLLLDEPTNHLDIASREILEDALTHFNGALIMVSHDRRLIDHLVEKLIIVESGRAFVHLGNYTHYRWKLREGADGSVTAAKGDAVMKVRQTQAGGTKKSERPERERKKLQKELQEIEANVEAMEGHLRELEASFGDIDPSDFEALQAQTADYEGLKQDLRDLYAEWERLAEQLA